MDSIGGRAASVLISVATALIILALVIPLFLNPIWVAFEQGRAEAPAWTGFSEPQLREATDAILADLVFGPPDFEGVGQCILMLPGGIRQKSDARLEVAKRIIVGCGRSRFVPGTQIQFGAEQALFRVGHDALGPVEMIGNLEDALLAARRALAKQHARNA